MGTEHAAVHFSNLAIAQLLPLPAFRHRHVQRKWPSLVIRTLIWADVQEPYLTLKAGTGTTNKILVMEHTLPGP